MLPATVPRGLEMQCAVVSHCPLPLGVVPNTKQLLQVYVPIKTWNLIKSIDKCTVYNANKNILTRNTYTVNDRE